eukprot:CAMPEP_0172712986 /NCGR_PEP_ID=MMETSP1074-20121228/61421_1 /TAXON_ID=2916 /ORGANISM="Ceratium fusus, Strain PA161109" /LENGTH=389 /DNA_ID=CAMNT_0013536999 /DNA_START=67 /DNA_END=1236 /DNA_ORIENTATION=-
MALARVHALHPMTLMCVSRLQKHRLVLAWTLLCFTAVAMLGGRALVGRMPLLCFVPLVFPLLRPSHFVKAHTPRITRRAVLNLEFPPTAEALPTKAGLRLNLPPFKDRTFLVTGATDGIGLYTAELLSKRGAMVILHGKDERKVRAAFQKIRQRHKRARLDGFVNNMKHMSEVHEMASEILKRHPVIHGVLHNAATVDGDFYGKKLVTKEDLEETLAVNTMAPFLLTSLLMDSVRSSGAGRFIFSSSASMRGGDYLDDLCCDRRWTGNHAYALSKLCLSMIAEELHQRYGDAPRLTFHAINPGLVSTRLQRQCVVWGQKARKGRTRDMIMRGLIQNVRTANASFDALTEAAFQVNSGSRLDASPDEVFNAEKRAQLWQDLVAYTGATWE